jgi:hypothetical protein
MRRKVESGYVEVQSQKSVTSAVVVPAQSAPASSAVPHEIGPESPASGEKEEA